MNDGSIRIRTVGAKISSQGERILRSLLEEGDDVVIGASAGTGKTTLLTSILAEAVIREVENRNPHPLDCIVAATFTVEAARQMKEKTRKLLTDYHQKHGLPGFDSILYSLEQESWILTIDSLTQKIIRKVALDIGLPPEVEVIDEFDNNLIMTDVFRELERTYPKEYSFLESATRDRTRQLLSDALAGLSLYVVNPRTLLTRIKKSFDLFYSSRLSLRQNKREVKIHNQKVANCFRRIFPEFVRRVRSKYREQCGYTYDELRTMVVRFLRSEGSEDWKNYFNKRFKLLLIDEFQDTSVAQTELLSQISGESTKIMIIGDPKQSIYTWRNAEPTIISSIIDAAEKGRSDRHFKRKFRYFPITKNFRSVKPLVELTNHLFSEAVTDAIFEDNSFTRGLLLPNPQIEPNSPCPVDDPEDSPHIHYYFTAARKRKQDKYSEPEFIAHLLGRLGSGKLGIRVRKEIENHPVWVEPKLGDCAILIPRRGKKWSALKALLIKSHIPYVMIHDQGFYQRPEISLLIDFLDWLGDPYQSDALLRILRSPFVGASDFLLRVLALNRFRLDLCALELQKLLQSVKGTKKRLTLSRDLLALERVMNLKRNLRWSREGRKAILLEAILQSSHFREILMTYPEGEQCVANLGLLCDVVDSWEEEEIISYPILVKRLKYYRASDPSYQSQAVLSDLENEDTVKVSTIHATKGLEFPVVFILDVDFRIESMWQWRNSGLRGPPPRLLYTGDSGKFMHIRQMAPLRSPYDLWKQLDGIYANEPERRVGFLKKMAEIYDDFASEKWRLYYVALTRARDHLFHGYNSEKGSASTWGNQFRDRLFEFEELDSEHEAWISSIDGPPTLTRVRKPRRTIIEYEPRPILRKINDCFHPSVIDPTHVYDLLLCPRRYQYGSLMGASGSKCDEAGHSQFSPVFGGVLHEMAERYDYLAGDTQASILHLDSKFHLKEKDRNLLTRAIRSFSEFMRDDVGLIGGPNQILIPEKQIHTCFNFAGRNTEMRGVIDLMSISGNQVTIYDIKTNYLDPNKGDSKKTKLTKEFMRNHHEYQLLVYKGMLEKLGYVVDGIHVMAVTRRKEGLHWNLINVEPDIDVITELGDLLPLEVTEDGLEARSNRFCSICEYRKMCSKS